MIRVFRTTPWLLYAAAVAVTAQAQIATNQDNTAKVIPGQIVVDESTTVVQNMKQDDPGLAELVNHAKAVFIVPRYGANPARLASRAERNSPEGNTSHSTQAMVRYGSPGVFLLRSGGWSAPAFFSIGISNAAMTAINNSSGNNDPANERGIPLVMMFMSSQAADHMQSANTVSLSGLNVARYSDSTRGSAPSADVVVWTPHAMVHQRDLTAEQIHFDGTASNAYYMNQVTLNDILASNVSTTRATQLQNALSRRVASK